MGFSKANGGIRFQDFTCFNKALLAKQVWRLWKTPNNLLARIVAAKYHPRGSILNAPLGKNPSFAWRSIQSSIDLVKKGLIWCTGNGKKARIWEDRWFPSPSTYKVHPPSLVLNPTSMVSNLIDDEGKWWKKDKLIWRGTTKGQRG
jgi:hypothetical protein